MAPRRRCRASRRLEQPGAEELAEAHAGELIDEITSAPIVINK
jgi:hypothetical protein